MKQFKKRNAILACLQQTSAHPSAEMVHEMLRQEYPDVSLATVYRNLNWFKSQGLIQSVATVSGVERFDHETHPHTHFICQKCDAVLDLNEVAIPQSLEQAAEHSSGCRIDGCQLTFTGLCPQCVTPGGTSAI